MANEISVSVALNAYKSSIMSGGLGRAVSGLLATMTGNTYSQGVISVGFAAAEVIPLGEVTSPGYCFLKCLDATNYIAVRNGSAGANVVKLRAGQVAVFPWDDAAVPYVQANTAACLLEFLILSL